MHFLHPAASVGSLGSLRCFSFSADRVCVAPSHTFLGSVRPILASATSDRGPAQTILSLSTVISSPRIRVRSAETQRGNVAVV